MQAEPRSASDQISTAAFSALRAEPPPRAAWRIDEAAWRMGVSRVTIYKLAEAGKLQFVKVAGRTLVPESEIVRLLTPASQGAA